MNSVNLIGRVANDPRVSMSSNGQTKIARFSIAVRRDNENTDFINCVAFGKTAELIEGHFPKGKPIGVDGRIQTGSYEKDGVKHYTTDVIVNQLHFLPREAAGASGASDAPAQAPVSAPQDDFVALAEDVPF